MQDGVRGSLATQRGIRPQEESSLRKDQCSLALWETASESTSPRRQQGLGAAEWKGKERIPTRIGSWGLGDGGGDATIFLSKGVG